MVIVPYGLSGAEEFKCNKDGRITDSKEREVRGPQHQVERTDCFDDQCLNPALKSLQKRSH